MPTPILTVQSNTPSPTPASKAPAGAGASFQRTLTQQIEQRQRAPRHEGQPARPAAANQQANTGAKPALPAARAGNTTSAKPADKAATDATAADQATADKAAGSAATDEAAADTADAAQGAAAPVSAGDAQAALTGPVVDMLALVASFQSIAGRAIEAAPQGDAPEAMLPGLPDAASAANATAAGFGLASAEFASIGATQPAIAQPGAAQLAGAQAAGWQAAVVNTRPEPATPEPASARSDMAKAEPAQRLAHNQAIPLTPERAADALVALTRENAVRAAGESAPNAGAVAAPLQQASLQIAQVASAIPADKLSGRVGTPGWDQQLGQKIVWMVAGGEQSASLTLNPPDLGPLQVVLSVSNDHADATFTASQPEVRQALEAALPRLREMMSEAGIELGQATVSAGMSNRQDGAGGETGRGFAGARGRAGTADLPGVAKATRAALPGMVDTFA